MRRVQALFIAAVLLLSATAATAQENPITNGELTTCEGFLVDTGLSAADYGNNEDLTMTICPLAPETITNLYWANFALGEGDYMEIYDGEDTSAPLIGTYEGNDLSATNVTASDTNPSGCLTVHFVSDATGVGNFGAAISCGLPCIPPVANAVVQGYDGQNTIKACIGEELLFDGSGTTFAPGTEIGEFTWDFADGNTNSTDWPTVTHAYQEPGGYLVQLEVYDQEGCDNNNVIDILILVETYADWGETPEEVHLCLGQEVDLTGEVTAPEWSNVPEIDFGGALYVPDDQTVCFSSEITVAGFEPGLTIDEIGDIESFFVNMEHSYMGDLTITFICPNNQTLTVHNQGGGSTEIGIPDPSDADNAPGEGLDYWWAPDADNGIWADEAVNFTDLPSGTYSSFDSWDNLEGCPVNGDWTIEICDLWGADNGFIFDWVVNFDPDMYPDPIEFQPSFGAQCDSTSWSGPFITNTSADCNTITIAPDAPGVYEYSFDATNDHGCVQTHIAEVIVSEVEVSAGGDVTFCQGITIDGTASIDDPFFTGWTYEWTPDDNLSSGAVEDPTVESLDATTVFTFTAYPTGLPECAASDQITIELAEIDPLVIDIADVTSPCPGTLVSLNASATGGHGGNEWQWSDGLGQEPSASADPLETTTYTISVEDACGWTAEEEVTVNVINPGTDITAEPLEVCVGGFIELIDINGGTGNYTWTLPLGMELQSNGTIQTTLPGFYSVDVVDDCIASGSIDVNVVVCEIWIPNVFSPDGVPSEDDNDSFEIVGLEFFPGSKLTVYNRWGNIVLEDADYKNDWSPTDLADGTYYYVLEVAMPDGTVEDHSGYVMMFTK